MDRSLFTFIWKHSKQQQLALLALTLLTFPFLYVSLELPKRIINDAIGASGSTLEVFGYELTQVEYLMILCFGFLLAVLANGLMKMRLNTMKGIVAERLLRRFRYQLLSRMMRFPKPYFRNTSQGELVAMVTSEAEPMGGLMGDAVAQPVFQAGQMLTILTFLFLQSIWFGLAAIALIPLQAYLIPMLQRQINVLNIERVREVRQFSTEIGETAAGMSDLRINGGVRYRKAQFTNRLGRLFEIRFKIYNKKFFMKFLNNFITQLTPFFFYAVGGYLAIQGEITVGALVAALAAYKDLSGPWKELLTYYNQVQDMSLRWEIVTERFQPRGMIDEALFEGEPEETPHLDGNITLRDVSVADGDGNNILEDISLDVPAGARVAIQSKNGNERAAFAELLTREVLPSQGSVSMNGHDLKQLHQAVIAGRIGYAQSRPYLFDGTLGDNVLMPLRTSPKTVAWDNSRKIRNQIETLRSGNSLDVLDADWLDPDLAGLSDEMAVRDWWFELVQAMGVDDDLFRNSLDARFDPASNQELADAVVKLRPKIFARLQERGLDTAFYRFDPYVFNPAIPLGGNLMFAVPTRRISQESLVSEGQFIRFLREQGLAEEGLDIAQTVIDILHRTFGRDGTDHPLFRRLDIDPETYERLVDFMHRRRSSDTEPLTEDEEALLMTVPFTLTAEQIGPAFPDSFKDKIVSLRRTGGSVLRERTKGMFMQVRPSIYIPRLTLLENAIYGRVSLMAGAKLEQIEDTVAEILAEEGLKKATAAIVYNTETGIGGSRLNTSFQERVAFSRAAIKRPDVLILDGALASQDGASRTRTRNKLRELLPNSTMIFMESEFANPNNYDLFFEIKDGRVDGVARASDVDTSDDFQRKLSVISRTDLFSRLDRRNQRLLAFSASWFDAAKGDMIFERGQRADAAYLCLKGKAELRFPTGGADKVVISEIDPGRLIGDLSIIAGQDRQLDLVAMEDSTFLRISAEEYKAVIQSDGDVAMDLLKTVSGYLIGAADTIRDISKELPDHKVRDVTRSFEQKALVDDTDQETL